MKETLKGMTGMMEKLLAAGANAETTDQVKSEERVGGKSGRAGERGVCKRDRRRDGDCWVLCLFVRHFWCMRLL